MSWKPLLADDRGLDATSNLGSSSASRYSRYRLRGAGLSRRWSYALGLGGLGVLLGAVLAHRGPSARCGAVIVARCSSADYRCSSWSSCRPRPWSRGDAARFAAPAGFTAVVYNVNQVSFRQAITPLDMQGRMNATMRFIVWGTMPLDRSQRHPGHIHSAANDDLVGA